MNSEQKEGLVVSDFERISLPQVNIDTLRQRLEELYKSRELGMYSSDIVDGEMALLEAYWKARSESNADFSKNTFDDIIREWDMRTNEFRTVILEDVLANGNAKTEYFLNRRDKALKKQNLHSTKDIHIFTNLDLSIVIEYVFGKTFSKYGFSNEELIKIGTKISRIKDKINIPPIFQYAYVAKSMEDCIYMARKGISRFFTESALINHIRATMNGNSKFIIGQDSRVTLAKANFINFACSQPDSFSDRIFTFADSDAYFDTLMMSDKQFYCEEDIGFKKEIEQAERMISYSSPAAPAYAPLTFSMIKSYVLEKESTGQFKEAAEKHMAKLFLGYAFGELSEADRKDLERKYFNAHTYFERNPQKKKELEEQGLLPLPDDNTTDHRLEVISHLKDRITLDQAREKATGAVDIKLVAKDAVDYIKYILDLVEAGKVKVTDIAKAQKQSKSKKGKSSEEISK